MDSYTVTDFEIAFMYVLLRDCLTAGRVEAIVEDLEKANSKSFILSNSYLAEYAENIVERLRKSNG